MTHVESYGSWEEAQEAMRKATNQAMVATSLEQWRVADGKKHYFIRLVSYGPGDVYLLVGQVFDLDEERQRELAKYGHDKESRAEVEESIAGMWQRLRDGYVFTSVSSVIEPHGELGDTHVSTVLEITEGDYQMFRDNDWDLGKSLRDPVLRPLIQQWVEDVHYQ